MSRMPDAYRQLLDAAIEHLQELQSKGVRSVSVSPEALAALEANPRKPLPQKPAALPATPRLQPIAAPTPVTPKREEAATPSAMDLSLGLPGERVIPPAAPGSASEGCRFRRLEPPRGGLREMPPPGRLPQERGVRRRQHPLRTPVRRGSARRRRGRTGRTVCRQGGAIAHQNHPHDRPLARIGLYRQYIEMPSGHPRPEHGQPQADRRGDGHVHSLSARAN